MQQIFVYTLLALFGGFVIASNEVPNLEGEPHIVPYLFEDLINSTIEGIRPDIPDPLRIESLNVTIPDGIEILKGAANVSNFELTGLQGFQLTYLNFDLFATKLNFTLVLPSINLYTDYWGNLTLLDLVPLYGEGKANFHILDAEVQGSAKANLTGGLSISNLRIQLYLGSATFDIHGALYNEDFSSILSQILNDVVASFVDDHQEVISDIASPILETLINAILSSFGDQTTTVAPADAATDSIF